MRGVRKMGILGDLTGKRFGKLTVVSFQSISEKGRSLYLLKCDCGNSKILPNNAFAGSGRTRSCGCMMRKRSSKRGVMKTGILGDLTGKRFGRLTVISFQNLSEKGRRMYLLKCDCGNSKILPANGFAGSGRTRSCGCLLKNRPHALDISGRRFGLLIAVSRQENSRLWICKCDCGGEKLVVKSHLVFGMTKSCGCLMRLRPNQRKTKWTPELLLLIGTDTDAEIERRTGINKTTIRKKRIEMGISLPEKKCYLCGSVCTGPRPGARYGRDMKIFCSKGCRQSERISRKHAEVQDVISEMTGELERRLGGRKFVSTKMARQYVGETYGVWKPIKSFNSWINDGLLVDGSTIKLPHTMDRRLISICTDDIDAFIAATKRWRKLTDLQTQEKEQCPLS